MLPQSGGSERYRCLVRDDLFVYFWVVSASLCQGIKKQNKYIYRPMCSSILEYFTDIPGILQTSPSLVTRWH